MIYINDIWCIVHNPAAHAGKYMHTCTKTGWPQTLLSSSVCYKHEPANDFFRGQPNFQCLIPQIDRVLVVETGLSSTVTLDWV